MRRPINDKAVGAWRRYERFLVNDMDQLSEAVSLHALLGHRWNEDPPFIVAHRLRLGLGGARAGEGVRVGAGVYGGAAQGSPPAAATAAATHPPRAVQQEVSWDYNGGGSGGGSGGGGGGVATDTWV